MWVKSNLHFLSKCNRAVEWYKKAAGQGDTLAQFFLGTMYEQGRAGLPQEEQAEQQATAE
ncbi:SEL1-like repeat protein [Candidatus Paracaedibacter symbiosus]|uniref:SEL1-like repeat protein n=1 Tax=Candidatus Paracaedibacter symbiosus TaxID=244582 RepID=UPI0012EC71CD